MNLLQMKQKMIDLGISSSYLAECCGVGKYYLNECMSGSGSHKMTGKLKQKIEGVFRSIEISKHKQERESKIEQQKEPKPTETFAPAPSNNMDYEKGMLKGIKIARKAIVDAINSGANPDSVITIMFALSNETDRIVAKLFGTNEEA